MFVIKSPAWVAAGAFCFMASALAAPVSNDQILQNQQQQLDQQREQLQRRPDVFAPPQAAPLSPIPLPTGQCFTVAKVLLDGAPEAWLGWLRPLTEPVLGHCLDLAGINALVGRLTDTMVARGFVTSRVLVPEQNLQSGNLRLVVVPGRIQEIRLKQGGSDWSLRSAFPTGPGEILNLRDLEQGLEQLSRVSSQQASMELLPGDQPGTSVVEVKRERSRPLHASLSQDDSGQEATGKNQASLQLSADNLLGFNDVLTLSRGQDAEQLAYPKSRSQSVSWLLPWGNWSLFASYSAFDYRQKVDGDAQSFQSSGESRNTLLSLTRLLHRDQTSKTDLALSMTRKASRSFIEDSELVAQRQDLSYLGLELSRRQYQGSAVWDGALGFTRGVHTWGGQNDALAAQGGPSARPEIYSARLSLTQPFKLGTQNLRASSALKAQYSRQLLFGTDQFSIGSRYSVRGFDDHSMAAQSGWSWRNELAWSLPLKLNDSSLESYVGLDVGQIAGPTSVALSSKRLSGCVIGLRASLMRFLSAEISHEQALTQPAGWNRQSITHFSLALQW